MSLIFVDLETDGFNPTRVSVRMNPNHPSWLHNTRGRDLRLLTNLCTELREGIFF